MTKVAYRCVMSRLVVGIALHFVDGSVVCHHVMNVRKYVRKLPKMELLSIYCTSRLLKNNMVDARNLSLYLAFSFMWVANE
jgi:hypothetical protein